MNGSGGSGGPRAPRVFLSYASEDATWVSQFTREEWFGKPLGNVFVQDFRDGNNLDFGPLRSWLDAQVDQASVMIAFVSKNYSLKDWTRAEWQAGLTKAQRGQLIFVPVMMDADAKEWWCRMRSQGELSALPPDYQYSDFTEKGMPAEIDERSPIIGKISRLAAAIRGMLETPRPDKAPDARPNGSTESQVPAPTDLDIFLLGHPIGRLDVSLDAEVNAAADELRKLSLSPTRWGDGWRNKPGERRNTPVSPTASPIFVQPVAPGEAEEPLAYAGKTAERLTAAGVSRARVALWLPCGEDDPIFETAAASAVADVFPALRTDTPQDLAAWLRKLVLPAAPSDTVVLELETIGFPEDREPDPASMQLADDIQQHFYGIVNREVRPSPGLRSFWGDMFNEQIKILPGNRAIIAVHDLDITPSADMEAVRAALEVKLALMQEAVDQANKDRKGARALDLFFAALLVKNAKALPFANYPCNGRFKDWRLLRFERTAVEKALIKPVPASLAVFRAQLSMWANNRTPGTAA